jgi:hypothetical protein
MIIHKSLPGRFLIFIIFMGIFLFSFVRSSHAGCVDISDLPIDTKVNAAPPIIMFVLDNSGSMDWEFLIRGQNQGMWNGSVRYVFDNPGDNNGGTILAWGDRDLWRSQWAGENRIYYNPSMEYTPWPTMSDADTQNPRSNPNNATPTFDLRDEYWSVAGPGGGLEVIVDDLDTGFSIINGNWQEVAPNDESYLDHFWHTDPDGEGILNTAQWTTTLPAGDYDVYGWWRDTGSYSTAAPFTIVHAEGLDTVYVNQETDDSQWNLLDEYTFNGAATVIMSHNPSGSSDHVAADAIRFVDADSDLITVYNAHYYTWNDANGNGALDSGEVYLVNFKKEGLLPIEWVKLVIE